MKMPSIPASARSAGLLRRLGALCYDSVLLAAILFVATALVLPLNGGEALRPGQWLYSAYLLAVTAFFFGWFWTHGGQTLGMKAWGLRVCRYDGRAVGWRQAVFRMLGAGLSIGALGLGYLWVLIDRERAAWHDRLSGTRVIRTEGPGHRGAARSETSGCPHQT